MAKFVMTDKHLYWWPVTVRVPDPDNAGTFIEQSFEMQFEAQPREAMIEAQERFTAAASDRERIEADKAQMRKCCRSWRGIVDADGADVPFSAERLDGLVDMPWGRAAIMTALAEANFGQEAKRGN